MKKKEKEALKSKTIAELTVLIEKKYEEINKRRIEIRTGRAKNTNLKCLDDELAIIKTIINEKIFADKGKK